MEYIVLSFSVLVLIIALNQGRKTELRLRGIENKVDSLLKDNGIVYDEKLHVSKPVLEAIALGSKLKAIRLYRQETGASLKQAQEVIERLVKAETLSS